MFELTYWRYPHMQALLHLPRIISGPGEYRAASGRTARVLHRRDRDGIGEEWWCGVYSDNGDSCVWSHNGVRMGENQTDRLLPVRPGLAYIRSYRCPN